MAVTSEERERVSFIIKRLTKMKDAKDRYSRNWTEYERIWKLFLEERKGEDAWRANLPDTLPYATIKTEQAAFVDSKVSPIFSRHEDEDQMKPRDLADLYKDIAEKGNIDQELYYARLDAFKFGMGFLETTYIEDRRKVKEIQEFNPDKPEDIKFIEKEVKDFDDPKTVRVSPWLIFVDEKAQADFANTADDYAKIEILSKERAKQKYAHLLAGGEEEFEERIKTAGVVGRLLGELHSRELATTADQNTRDASTFQNFQLFAPFELSEDAIEIVHYWNWVDDTYEITAMNEPIKVDTKEKPSPIPYISKQLPLTPIPFSPYSGDEFWAAGIIEIGRADSRAIRKNSEMMADRQKISLFKPAFTDVNDEIDQRDLKLKPLSLIRTRGGKPTFLDVPGITNADLSMLKVHEDSFKRSVGIDDRVLGVSPQGARLTATEVAFLREAALRRLREFAFLYKNALLREVNLKLKLFEQYYASPFVREEHVVDDQGVKRLKIIAKQFKVSTSDNVYTKRDVTTSLFEGDIDIDLDMKLLIPMTPAQLVTKWAQVLRDITPFVQAGVIDLSLEKVIERYLDAMEVSIESLREDKTSQGVEMAEGEHRLLANKNTSRKTLEDILPDGTPLQFLNAAHIKRHIELIETDDNIEESEKINLVKHIAIDRENLLKKLAQEQQKPDLSQVAASPNLAQVGGVAPQAPAPITPPAIGQGEGEGLITNL